ncbi:hypothetical protein TNIN_258141, partial [Trichonephila inaurata madagascariensis]
MLQFRRQNARFFSNATRVMKGEFKSTPNTTFKIRPMRTDEIPQVVKLTSRDHFQYPLSTLKFWHTRPP